MPVSRLDLTALLFNLAEQPGVLDRQGGLAGEGLQEIHNLG